MKKLIALAVAAAVAAPAMAAVSVSGTYNVEYVDSSDNTVGGGADTQTVQSYDVDVAVSASAELDNGTTVSASLEADDSDNDGSLTFTGAWGSIGLGDVAGALDSVDGVAVATARDDLAAGAGTDASVAYTFPTLVEGLTLKASVNAEDGGNGVENEDASSIAASYTMGGLSVFAGTEDRNTADVTGYGVSYSMAGFTVGYGFSEVDNDTGVDVESTGLAAGYTAGNLTIAVNTLEVEGSDNVKDNDKTTVSVAYVLGGGVTAYASSTSDDVAQATGASSAYTYEDITRVGVKFAF